MRRRKVTRCHLLPCTQAGEGEFPENLRRELEGTLRGLVTNYSARRNALLEEILPEVGVLCLLCCACFVHRSCRMEGGSCQR
jgi:hypothetical protein